MAFIKKKSLNSAILVVIKFYIHLRVRWLQIQILLKKILLRNMFEIRVANAHDQFS